MANESKHSKWSDIEAAARELGVSDEALRKWNERDRVPGKWQVPIIVQSRGRVQISDFVQRESA